MVASTFSSLVFVLYTSLRTCSTFLLRFSQFVTTHVRAAKVSWYVLDDCNCIIAVAVFVGTDEKLVIVAFCSMAGDPGTVYFWIPRPVLSLFEKSCMLLERIWLAYCF